MPTDTDDRTTYYYVNGKKVALVREPSVFAVRFRKGEHLDSSALSVAARRFLQQESEHVAFEPQTGLQIYRVRPRNEQPAPPGQPRDGGELPGLRQPTFVAASERAELRVPREDLFDRVETLAREDAVEFAAPGFKRAPGSPSVSFVTSRFLV